MERTRIIEFIYEAIDETNTQQAANNHLLKSLNTILIGPGGSLDSLGLVNFIVALEGVISDKLDIDVALADERAMMQEESPFRTVDTLADYIEVQIKDQN
jgi:acyl carrier protein